MRTIIYFILFIASLVWTINNLFNMGKYHLEVSNTPEFMVLFACTFLSVGGAILFGYAWKHEMDL